MDRVEEAELVLDRDIPARSCEYEKNAVRIAVLCKRRQHTRTQHRLTYLQELNHDYTLQITNTTNTFAQMPRQSHDLCLESAHEFALTIAFDLPQT